MIAAFPSSSQGYLFLPVISGPQGLIEIPSEINDFLKMHVVNFVEKGFRQAC